MWILYTRLQWRSKYYEKNTKDFTVFGEFEPLDMVVVDVEVVVVTDVTVEVVGLIPFEFVLVLWLAIAGTGLLVALPLVVKLSSRKFLKNSSKSSTEPIAVQNWFV